MKRLIVILTVFVLCFSLFAAIGSAAETVSAEDVLSYEGLSTRVGGGKPGVRSLWKADKAAVAALEADGYTVAFGAIVGVARDKGVPVTLDGSASGTPITARALTVTKGASGYTANTNAAKVVTVYETGSPSYATGVFLTDSASAWGFAYTTIWSTEEYRTAVVYEGTELCYTGFVALTKNGNTEYAYTYAEGDLFGAEGSTYGTATSLYEISSYFMNDYRAGAGDSASIYADNAIIRATVAICGITVTADEMKNNGSASVLNATANTDKTIVVSTTGSGNGITFSVANARTGFYKMLLRVSNNALVTSEVRINVNGRLYNQRIIEGDTLASENYAVAKDDNFRNVGFYVMLDEGKNNINLYMESGSYNTPFGVAAADLVLFEEITPRDVVLAGVESLNVDKTVATGASTDEFNEPGTINGKTVNTTAFIRKGYLVYNVHIPVDGVYDLSALAVIADNNAGNLKVSFAKDGAIVAEKNLVRNIQHGGSRSVQYADLDTWSLTAGDYELTIGRNSLMAMSNLLLSFVRPFGAQEEAAEDILTEIPGIACWGDSLTYGTNYPTILTNKLNLLTDGICEIPVVNLGVAGETSITIAGRAGALPYVLSQALSIPATTDRVRIYFTAPDGQAVDPLRWMEYDNGISVNDVEIAGVKGKLIIEKTSANAYGSPYYFQRNEAGTAKTVPVGTKILTSGREYAEMGYYPIIFMGQNGGWNNDPATLVSQINAMIGDAEKYLIIGLHTGNSTSRAALESAMQTAFGNRYINIRTIFANENIADRVNDLCDASYVLTPEDLSNIAAGKTPSFLMADGLHFNEYGYTVLGEEVYARMVSLGDLSEVSAIAETFRSSSDGTTDKNTVYEIVDAGFTAGAIKSNGSLDETVANAYVSAPILAEKAGTTFRITVQGTLSGFAGSDILTVAVQKSVSGSYVTDLEHPLTASGAGYLGAAGYMTYYVTTTEDNTVLRFSVKANEKAAIGVTKYEAKNDEGDDGQEEVTVEYTKTQTAWGMHDDGWFELAYRVTSSLPLTERVTVTGVDATGEFTYVLEYTHVAGESAAHVFEGAARTELVNMKIVYGLYYGEKLVYEETKIDYTAYHKKLEGITVVTIGDSYFDDPAVAPNMWINLLDKKYDLDLYNRGYSGTTVSNNQTIISSGATSAYYPMVDRFDEGASRQMPDVDADLVFFDGGRNDFTRDVPLGSVYNPDRSLSMDETTFCGAANSVIAQLREKYPNATIILFTCYYLNERNSNTGHRQYEFAEALMDVAEANGLACFNNGDQELSGVYMDSLDFRTDYCKASTDVSHLNADGMKRVFPTIETFIANNFEGSADTPDTPEGSGIPDDPNDNTFTDITVTLGDAASTDAKLTVNNAQNGTVFALAYDKGERLIGVSKLQKTAATQSLDFDFTFDGTAAKLRFVLVANETSYTALAPTCEVTAKKRKAIPAEYFSLSAAYLANLGGNEYSFVAYPDEPYSKGAKVVTLENGTNVLTISTDGSLYYAVNAPATGIYKIQLKANTMGGYIEQFIVRNASTGISAWDQNKHRGESRFGTAGTASSASKDADYAVPMSTVYGEFTDDMVCYVYLVKGENKLQICMWINNTSLQATNKIGLHAMRFTLVGNNVKDTVFYSAPMQQDSTTGQTDTLGTSSTYNDNGWMLRQGTTVHFNISVPKTAEYKVYALGSASTASLTLSSLKSGSTTITVTKLNQLNTHSTSTLPLELGTIQLPAGTNTMKLSVTAGYFHVNTFMFVRADGTPTPEEPGGDKPDVPTPEEPDDSGVIFSDISVSFGNASATDARVTLNDTYNGTLLALVYDRGDYLIGYAKSKKTSDTQTFDFDFSFTGKSAKIRFVYVADEDDYEALAPTYEVTASGTKKISSQYFSINEAYLVELGGNPNSFVVDPDEATTSANVVTLENGTNVLSYGTDGSVYYTVNAPAEGFYKVQVKGNYFDGYVESFIIRNASTEIPLWSQNSHRGESRFGSTAASSATGTEDYAVSMDTVYGDFTDEMTCYVYLVKGENKLQVCVVWNSGSYQKSNKFGLHAMRFTLVGDNVKETVFFSTPGAAQDSVTGQTDVLGKSSFYNGGATNGWMLRTGTTLYFNVSIPKSGEYRVYALGCASTSTFTLSSLKSGDSLTQTKLNALNIHSASTLALDLGTIDLSAGTNTMKFEVTAGYFHANMFMFAKVDGTPTPDEEDPSAPGGDEPIVSDAVISGVSASFGVASATDAKITVTDSNNGTMLALVYDRGDRLIAVEKLKKTTATQSFDFNFSFKGTAAKIRLVYILDEEDYAPLAPTYEVTAKGVVEIPSKYFTVNEAYLTEIGGNENSFVVYPDEATSKGANVVTLENGTNVLTVSTPGSIFYTVNAPAEGFYKVQLKANYMGAYIEQFIIRNTSTGLAPWDAHQHRAESRFGTSGVASAATSDADYAVPDAVLYGDFTDEMTCYVYLVKGENKLQICVWFNNANLQKTNKLGLHAMRFTLTDGTTDDAIFFSTPTASQESVTGKTDVVPSTATLYNSNGWFLRQGATFYFNLTVPEAGEYEVTILGCASTATFTLSSLNSGSTSITGTKLNVLNTHSTSTVAIKLGTMQLPAGTNTLKLEVTAGYFHANMFMFAKAGEGQAPGGDSPDEPLPEDPDASDVTMSGVSATFGVASATDAKITVTDSNNGTMLALVYDKGEYLIGVEKMKKTSATQTFDFDFDFEGTAAKIRFVYVANETTYAPLASTYEVTAKGTTRISKDHFTVNAAYLANVGGNENSFVVYPDEATSLGANVVSLENGTNVLTISVSGAVNYSVYAPATGFYKMDLKANNMGGYIDQFIVRNMSTGIAVWGSYSHRGESRFDVASGTAASASKDADFAVPMSEIYGDFTGEKTCYVYLVEGKNNLQVCMWVQSTTLQKTNKLGLHAMRFTLVTEDLGSTVIYSTPTASQDSVTGQTDVLPTAQSKYNDNGWNIREGATIYFNVTVPKAGVYTVTALGCGYKADITLGGIKSGASSISKNVNVLNIHSTSTVAIELGTLELAAGENTLKLSVSGTGAYFHANLFMFTTEGDGEDPGPSQPEPDEPEVFDATVSNISAAFGSASATDVKVAVSGTNNGTVLALVYDAADYLIAVERQQKTASSQAFDFNFSFKGTAAKIRLVYVANEKTYTMLAPAYEITASGTVEIPSKAFTVDASYLANVGAKENSFIVYPDAVTTKGANVVTLSDGTNVLASTNGTVYYTVTAPASGFYKVEMKANRMGGYIKTFIIRNASTGIGIWSENRHRGESRFGTSGAVTTATKDEDYAIPASVMYDDFAGEHYCYVYLVKGQNNIQLVIENDSGMDNRIGINAMRFTLDAEETSDSVVYSTPTSSQNSVTGQTDVLSAASGGSSYNNNGWFLRGGSEIYFNITVPADGEYTVWMLGCVYNGEVVLSSLNSTSLPIINTLTAINTHSSSTVSVELGKIQLSKGTHTMKLVVSGSYFHANLFMFTKTGEYNSSASYMTQQKSWGMHDDGAFELSYRVIGCAPSGAPLTERVTVTGVDAAGAFSYVLEYKHAAGETDTTYIFEGAARQGLVNMTITYGLYDGEECIYEIEKISYDAYRESLKDLTVVAIGDSYFDDPAVAPNMWINLLDNKYNLNLYNQGYTGSTVSNNQSIISSGAVSALNPMVDRFDTGAPRQMPDVDADLVFFDGGRNDFSRDVPIGSVYNPDGSLSMDETTFCGAANSVIAQLRAKYPNAVIIVFTCYYLNERNSVTGHLQYEFAEAMMAVAEANGVACFNNGDQELNGVYMDSAEFRTAYCKSSTDVSHLNADGMKRVFPIIETFIADNYENAKAGGGSESSTATVGKATFGASNEAEVNVTFEGGNGNVYVLAYDSSESLIGWKKLKKTMATQTFSVTFDSLLAKAESYRILLVSDNFTTLSDTYRVTASGVTTIAKADFAINTSYLASMTAGVADSVVVYPDAFTVGTNASKLSTGTVLLSNNGEMTFTVNAPVEGIYKVDIKHMRLNGYIRALRIYNKTATAWYDASNTKSHGESRIGESGKASTATSDESYAISAYSRYVNAFDGTAELYVYLVKGENELTMQMITDVSGNKLGIDAICFSPATIFTEDTIVLPTATLTTPAPGYTNQLLGSSAGVNGDYNNGWFVRNGSVIYFNVDVAEAGQYRLVNLGSANAATITVKSANGSFLPITSTHTELLTHAQSTLPFTLGVLNLSEGTHTFCVSLNGTYYHTNLFALIKVAEYDPESAYSCTNNEATLNIEDGAFRISYNVIGRAPDGGMMTEKLVVTVTEKTTGTVTYTMVNERTSPETNHVFERDGVTGGLVDIKIVYQLWNGDELLYEAPPISYTPEEKLNVIMLSDLHYCGTNADINLWHSEKGIINQKTAIKLYAPSDCEQTDNYGWDSERRAQRIVDELIRLKKAGKLDIVFILGDLANNESNYDNYMNEHIKYEANPLGASLADFWESPANYVYSVKKLFLDQLSAAGIPYFVANGNHDFVYEPNRSHDDLDFTAWERLFHTAELFGHRTEEDNGEYIRDLETDEYINYSDSDSVHYLVRVIRRNGEVKLVSALSSEELEAFKVKYAGDGNYYDCYVSEDTITESDTLLASFAMVNGHQWDSYKDYYEKHIYKDPATGQWNYWGQTIRYSNIRHDLVEGMMEYAKDYQNVYFTAHLLSNADAAPYVKQYKNIKGAFTGDVHTEEVNLIADGVYNYVDGHNVTAFHYDVYYNADGSKDLQYFNNRGSNALTNTFWSDFLRHPYGYLTLDVAGSVSILNRVKTSGYYENGTMDVTGGSLYAGEIRYERAVADPARFNSGDLLYVIVKNGESLLLTEAELNGYGLTKSSAGVREVYVGCDSAEMGTTYHYLHSTYEVGKHNPIDYLVDRQGNVYNTGGALLGTATKLGKNFITEGETVSYNGATYTIGGAIGEVFGHYLYDEKGDSVFRDKNGNYVFIEAQLIREGYVEASLQEEFTPTMYNGPYERFWYYRNSAGEFITLDADGDGILDDGTYTDLMISTSYKDWHYVGSLFTSGTGPKIVVKDGKITSGEAWARFGYVRNYMLADGTSVSETDLVIDYDANGNIVYGFYQPTFTFAEMNIFRN